MEHLNSQLKPTPNATLQGDKTMLKGIHKEQLQELFDTFYASTGLGVSLVTSDKRPLARAGWQHICTHFHASNPKSEAICRQSEHYFENRLVKGEPLLHKCQNGLYEKAVGLYQNDERVAILYFGQFFKKDEPIDKEFFIHQAESLQFDVDAYINELKHIPLLTNEKLDAHIALMRAILANLTGLE
jgi:ligand-binding sensor protein